MKRIAAALMIAGVGLLTGSAVVEAYPPGSGTVTVSDSTPAAGGTFTVDVDNCTPGETVTVTFESQTVTATCAADGTASASLAAPAAAGTYAGTAAFSDTTISFSVTVEAAPSSTLPTTGSSGTNSTMLIATILLLAGAGMFGVAQVRRRQTLAG